MNDLMEWLMNYALDRGIGFIATKQLKPDTPSQSDCSQRVIVINMNWHNRHEIPFMFAHEIGHILNGDAGVHQYSASSVSIKEEHAADLTGLRLILQYCRENNIAVYNPTQFCECFGVPGVMENAVKYEISTSNPD